MSEAQAHRQYFDEQAAAYDTYTAAGAWTPNVVLREVLQRADVGGVRTALDLGTGTGQSLEAVHGLYPDAELRGVDVSPGMLQKAAEKVPTAHLEAGDLVPYVEGLSRSFDLITAIGCLESVPTLDRLLPRLAAHVTADGWLAFTFTPLIAGLEGHDRPEHQLGRGTRTYYNWSTVELTTELTSARPGSRLVSSRLFKAYERAGVPVIYELLLVHVSR